ncbi:MAG TPA: sigma-70 family RNA polymerase sigma factor [Bacteroidia bacterium]|nr:sigma-70 family RNA polymerase sigma factor [Bacteroidia bacterium]
MSAYNSETELLAGLRKGESAAFRRVYVLHYNMVRHLVISNSGREEDAKDLFQEALVVLFGQLSGEAFTLSSSLKTWLYAVCRNKWLKQLEKNKRNVRFTDFEPAENISVPAEKEVDEHHSLLRKSLEQLGVQCRKLLLLFYYFHKSMDEIAAELHYTNADNAKAQKYKCLQKLKSIYRQNPAADGH